MRDLEERLKELGDSVSRRAPSQLRPTSRAVRRIRVGRAVRSGVVLTALAALALGGFAGARSLTNDEGVLPAEEHSTAGPFVDTWISTDADGSSQTMTIRALGEDSYEITVQDDLLSVLFFEANENGKYVRTVKDVCSGSPATMRGTGRAFGSRLTILSPEITCDDGSEPRWKVVDDLPPLDDQYRGITFEHDPESDILTSSSGQNDVTLLWARAEAENRIGDVSGWITHGDKRGIWARNLTTPADPVRLSSTPGRPIAWSADGSKLLVERDDEGLFVVDQDGSETRLTDANRSTDGASFSPDGTAVVYASSTDDSSAIYVVDAEGGSSQLLLSAGSRRYPDPDNPGGYKQSDDGDALFETAVQEPKWSPDGSQIAYFEGMGDWGNGLRIMDSDGTDSRVVVENSETLGVGHVYGLEWSPDGSQLAFSTEGRLYVVGVDGSGFRLVTDDGVRPYWSPDGSYIAYTRPDPETFERGGSLEIVRLDDLRVQNFGRGESGPWTPEI